MEMRDEDVVAIVDDRVNRGHALAEALDWTRRAGIGTDEQNARIQASRAPATAPLPVSALIHASGRVMDLIVRAADAGYRIVVAFGLRTRAEGRAWRTAPDSWRPRAPA
jgi:hypothetical protein